MYMKRIIIIFTLLLGIITEAGAVLKEKDLEQTLAILKVELKQYNDDLTTRSAMRKERNRQLIFQLVGMMKQADQNALMLYSQQQDNVFDLTYACREATKQYKDFQRQQLPFKTYLTRTEASIVRYDSLITSLKMMPDRVLSQEGRTDRDSCMVLATSIRGKLAEGAGQLERNIGYYTKTEKRLRELNEYAQKRYNDIQTSIFINGGENYADMLSTFDKHCYTAHRKGKIHKQHEESAQDHPIKFFLFLFHSL